MKNLFHINESEKDRILSIHRESTKRQYLNEQGGGANTNEFAKFPCVTKHPKAKSEKMTNGSIAYNINGTYYYSNGRKKLPNGTMVNYTCNDSEFKAKPSSPKVVAPPNEFLDKVLQQLG